MSLGLMLWCGAGHMHHVIFIQSLLQTEETFYIIYSQERATDFYFLFPSAEPTRGFAYCYMGRIFLQVWDKSSPLVFSWLNRTTHLNFWRWGALLSSWGCWCSGSQVTAQGRRQGRGGGSEVHCCPGILHTCGRCAVPVLWECMCQLNLWGRGRFQNKQRHVIRWRLCTNGGI